MALIAAIAFLMIFMLLGTAYVRYMTIEFDDARNYVYDLRARHLANGGVQAGIGEIQAALASESIPSPHYDVELAAFRQEKQGSGDYPQTIAVHIQDEAARVNLNYAPAPLLEALGLDANTIQALNDYRTSPGNPLLPSVDALRTNNLIDAQKFQALDKRLFTVYTAEDTRQPHSYINLNAAPPPVLAAVFGIDLEEARTLAGKRPFKSWADVLQKVGRDPTTFNVPVPRYAPRDMPRELALSSNCYRLAGLVDFSMPGGGGRAVRAATEAVVLFHDDGTYTIRYWNERRGAEAAEIAPAQSAPATEPTSNQQPQADSETPDTQPAQPSGESST